MAKLTLAKALKEKNKLVKKIHNNYTKIRNDNKCESFNKHKYDISDLISETDALLNKLVELKVKIQTANVNILPKIYLLSELKSYLEFLKTVPVDADTSIDYDGNKIEYTVQIDYVEMENEIKVIEEDIDSLQDELDSYNHNTYIEIDL